MRVDESISKYDHPYVTVDAALFRLGDKPGTLDVKLYKNKSTGKWCLPGGFMPVDRLAMDVLREKVEEKTGEEGFYAEQLKTYDDLDRDGRARVVSIAYLCLTRDWTDEENWWRVDGKLLRKTVGQGFIRMSSLGFDHAQIITDAIARLGNKLWWSDLPGEILPYTFRLSDAQALFEALEGKTYYTNFKRMLSDRIEAMGMDDDERRPGRKAVLYRWKGLEG